MEGGTRERRARDVRCCPAGVVDGPTLVTAATTALGAGGATDRRVCDAEGAAVGDGTASVIACGTADRRVRDGQAAGVGDGSTRLAGRAGDGRFKLTPTISKQAPVAATPTRRTPRPRTIWNMSLDLPRP